MAWTTPGTATAGSVLTASWLNTNVRDNTNDLRSYQNRFASYRYSSGNITLANTTTWSTLTTIGTAGDLTLNASTGDVIEASMNALVGNQAIDVAFDVVTVVGSTVTNSFGYNGAAQSSWSGYSASGWYLAASAYGPITGSLIYTLQAGDISSGQVKLRVVYANSTTPTTRTLFAQAADPFMWWARNLGPVTT